MLKFGFCLYRYVLNAIYCILGAPTSRLGGGPNHLAPALREGPPFESFALSFCIVLLKRTLITPEQRFS